MLTQEQKDDPRYGLLWQCDKGRSQADNILAALQTFQDKFGRLPVLVLVGDELHPTPIYTGFDNLEISQTREIQSGCLAVW